VRQIAARARSTLTKKHLFQIRSYRNYANTSSITDDFQLVPL
jgi:hypothetical protein